MGIEAGFNFPPWLLANGLLGIGIASFVIWGGVILVLRRFFGDPTVLVPDGHSDALFGWLGEIFIGMISAALSFGWVAGNALDNAYRAESAYLSSVRLAASGLPSREAAQLERAVKIYASDVVKLENKGKESSAATTSLKLLTAICQDVAEHDVGSPQSRATLTALAKLLPTARQTRLSAINRYHLPFPPGLIVAPLALALLVGATVRTRSNISDAVFNGLHAAVITVAAAFALAMVLPTVAVVVPTTLIELSLLQEGAMTGTP